MLSVPAQAVLGGITVLTHLNPWVVSGHFLFSMAIVSLAVLYLWRLDRPRGGVRPGRLLDVLSRASYAVAVVVLALGTMVTGSGPHAGDATAPRNGLDPLLLSHLHADLVFVLLALTVVLVVKAPGAASYALLAVEVAQGVVGFVQYYNGLPVAVVELHLLGAALLAATVTWAVLHAREPTTEPQVG
jgi:cytochrome c oxidase assembly protein subunit 15